MLLLDDSPYNETSFDYLCQIVSTCQKCERMTNSQRVLNRSAGSLNAKLMFIGEAPGRLGADGTGIPFHGDKAGHNFEELLDFAGIDRSQIFVTNAVLCNPKDHNGNNSTPLLSEVENCNSYLEEQIEIINPKIVVTLGAVSLKSTSLIENHNLQLREHVRTANRWFNRILIPLYHPGQRAMLHRSFANQRSDYQFVADYLKKIQKSNIRKYGFASKRISEIVVKMLAIKPSISYFALHKLFYLIEYSYFERYHSRLTNAYFVRQKDGPYCTDLHPVKLKKSVENIVFNKNNDIVFIANNTQLHLFSRNDEKSTICREVDEIIEYVMGKYGLYSHAALKTAVYLTLPMRNVLKHEKTRMINMYNSPIEFI